MSTLAKRCEVFNISDVTEKSTDHAKARDGLAWENRVWKDAG